MRIRRALGAAAVAILALTGCWAVSPDSDAPVPVNEVAVFNDGFVDSKRDDCDQGFKPACDWLANNR